MALSRTVNCLSVQCLMNLRLMHIYLRCALLLLLFLFSLTEARPQKKIKSSTEPLTSQNPKKEQRTSAQKSYEKLFKGLEKGNNEAGSRYYLVKTNSNGKVLILIFCSIISVNKKVFEGKVKGVRENQDYFIPLEHLVKWGRPLA